MSFGMTRQDFVDQFQTINRTIKQFVWTSVAVFFVLTLLTIVPMFFLKIDGTSINATIAVYAVVMMLFIGAGCGRYQRRLCCAKCAKPLYGRQGRKVYETGKCPDCGEVVFSRN